MYLKVLLIIFVLLSTGCQNPSLPSHPQDIQTFIPIPEESTKKTYGIFSFNFSQKNFPDECQWHTFTRVVDGDTIIVDKNIYVRFIGIDTPETKHPDKKVSPLGLKSSQKTKELIGESKKVCLIQDSVGDTIDKYQRQLAYIFDENGTDINAELLKTGWAKGYFSFPFDRKAEFEYYQQQAKKAHFGIWSQ